MQAVLSALRARLLGAQAPQHGEIVLVQRRIFILPTRAGVAFGAVLALMLVGSINYGLGLGLLLTFLLGSFGITAMLHTYRNLAGMRVTPVRAKHVFAGESAQFGVCLDNPTQTARHSIHLTCDGSGTDVANVPAAGSVVASTSMLATSRGILRPRKLTLHTRFPVGLYHAWAPIELDMQCLVYPRPAATALPLPLQVAFFGDAAGPGVGSHDFSGLRQYQPGDSPRHIAWKAAARERGLLVKQFSGGSSTELWLSFDVLPPRLDLEDKLSQLTRWVLDAHVAGFAFGLTMPNLTVEIGGGERHRERCLEALALYPSAPAPAPA